MTGPIAAVGGIGYQGARRYLEAIRMKRLKLSAAIPFGLLSEHAEGIRVATASAAS
jgi:hypothetical protein